MGRAALSMSLITFLALAFDAGARPRIESSQVPCLDEDASSMVTQRGPVSLSQARQMALQRSPGRVVRAQTVTQSSNRRVHQIRILDAEGRVRDVRIDAQTGAFL